MAQRRRIGGAESMARHGFPTMIEGLTIGAA